VKDHDVTRIPEKLVKDYLAASMGYSGSDRWRDPALLTSALQVYQEITSAGHTHLPFFLAVDLCLLAQLGLDFTYAEGSLEGLDPLLRARYENEVLNRLLREHCVQQALELLRFYQAQAHERPARQAAFELRAQRLAFLLLERLAPHWPARWVINPAHLRGRAPQAWTPDELAASRAAWAQGAAKLLPDVPDLDATLSEFIHSATGSAAGQHPPVAWAQLLQRQDLFELAHHETLHKEYLRLGARHTIDVMDSLPELDPHDVELKEEESETETHFLDESFYPTGGFSELTTRGSFENLVLSELIYMDEGIGDGAEHLRGIDLFDVRFVENELLYYTRDSGQLQRKRRTVHMVLDLRQPLTLKWPEHPYQLGTLAAGLCLALVRDLLLLFSNDALAFEVALWVSPQDLKKPDTDAARLTELLTILLEGPIKRDLLKIRQLDQLDPDALGQARRKTYLLYFSLDRPRLAALAPRLAELRVASPPLFGTAINLSGTALDTTAPERVLHLGPSRTALLDLKRAVLLDIMHGRGAATLPPLPVDPNS
jgi:hypothetical protein